MDDQKYDIRFLVPGDLPEILDIERASFPDPWSLDSFRGTILNERFVSLGIFQGGLRGYLIAVKVVDELHILNIAVRKEKRRMGLGGVLMDYVFKLYEGSIKFAYLEVRISNESAIKFYSMRGFRSAGIRKRYYRDGEDALLMTLEINELGNHN